MAIFVAAMQMKKKNTRLRIGLLLVLIPLVTMTITRLLFYGMNASYFQEATFMDFLYGSWFELVTIGLFTLPFFAIYFFPIRWNKGLQVISVVTYFITFLLLIIPNLIDVEYFKYTGKRSTGDVLSVFSNFEETVSLIKTFFVDFWYYAPFLVILFYFGIRFLNRLMKKVDDPYASKSGLKRVILWLVSAGLLVLIGRGGFGFKPVTVIDIAKYTSVSNVALVNNTTFSIVKTLGKSDLQELDYFASIAETEQFFNPIVETKPARLFKDKPNVVVIILESFGKEFIGFYSGQKTYTPFLDSLLGESLTFEHAFANGKKSIEALPSIFASIPSLMETPYIVSTYGANGIQGLPEILGSYGYHSAFFHGATNGSMRFDTFSQLLGFKEYYGRTEYGNEAHADATWGILDEYFNPWTAKKLSSFQEPFMAGLFTLSSHHPFFIPEHRKNEVIQGKQPVATSISYGDIALRLFFEEAKKYKYYNNTVFILMADHTPASTTPYYNQRDQIFQIPFAIFTPNGSIKAERSLKNVQQLDVVPTVLELANIKRKTYTFGQSIFDNSEHFGMAYLSNAYYLWNNNRILEFANGKIRNLFDLEPNTHEESTTELPTQEHMVEVLKAKLQRYNSDLIKNQTIVQ